jgi:hypothetical protein
MNKKDFKSIVNHIFPIRDIIDNFDYPDYASLSNSIINKLSCEADAMQDILRRKFFSKQIFSSAYKDRLSELGELII